MGIEFTLSISGLKGQLKYSLQTKYSIPPPAPAIIAPLLHYPSVIFCARRMIINPSTAYVVISCKKLWLSIEFH
jgi:hypothetical protein